MLATSNFAEHERNYVRVVRLVGTPGERIVRDGLGIGVLPWPSLIPDQGIFSGWLVDGI